jgi:hypothetical protein
MPAASGVAMLLVALRFSMVVLFVVLSAAIVASLLVLSVRAVWDPTFCMQYCQVGLRPRANYLEDA